jgi:hypothetical protein
MSRMAQSVYTGPQISTITKNVYGEGDAKNYGKN